jgi:glutamine synthetase
VVDAFVERDFCPPDTPARSEPTPRWRQFLERHAEIEGVDLLLPDLNAVLRGKRIRASALPKVFAQGVNLPLSIFGTDVTGKTVEATRLGYLTGDKDGLCFPVPATLARMTWTDRPLAQVMLAMHVLEGTPFWGDPRQVLSAVTARLAALELRAVVALEMEFYLIDPRRRAGAPRIVANPVTARAQRSTKVYSISDLEDFEPVVEGIARAAAAQGVPADAAIAEYAPGQFEINLHHVADAVTACDHLVMLKRLIRGVARQHGSDATFMAKPFAELAGSGMHVHVSLLDRDGRNIFATEGDPEQQPQLRHAVAGMLETMAPAMLLFAPHANSYRRFRSGSFAPTRAAWGGNNRTVAVRIPAGRGASTRLEHRVAGADANPYLLTAGILAGIHLGLSRRLDPPPAARDNAYEAQAAALPGNWYEAIRVFAGSPVMADYLGEDFHRTYHSVKSAEFDEFNAAIQPLEYEWYLRSV